MQSCAKAEGRAWWNQLRYDKAVEAGCGCYVHRPATSDGSHRSQVLDHGAPENSRPAGVPASATIDDLQNIQSKNKMPQLRRSTAKLPARKAVVHVKGEQVVTTLATTCHLPPSRGNDWSPIHSRPHTRGVMRNYEHVARTETAITPKAVLDIAPRSLASQDVLPKPAKYFYSQQDSPTLSGNILSVTTAQRKVSSPKHQRSAASVTLSATASADSQTALQKGLPPSVHGSAASFSLSPTTSAESQASHDPVGPTHAAQAAATSKAKEPPVRSHRRLVIPQQRVRVVSMLHPGPRQHRKKLLEVCCLSNVTFPVCAA